MPNISTFTRSHTEVNLTFYIKKEGIQFQKKIVYSFIIM